MAILENLQFRPCDAEDDPDDYRPGSSWAVAVDPSAADGAFVRDVTLGDETRRIVAGAMVFVPADAPHGARNVGATPARFLGVFPRERFDFRYLERNPAPGTEGEPPQPPFELDARA